MPTTPSSSTVKRLYAVSSNRCAFPKCSQPLVHEGKVTGRICHIKAASPQGPRFDPVQTEVDRHGFANLLLLCPIHHDVVDDDLEAYSVQRLVNMKSEHERLPANVLEPDDEFAAQFVTRLRNVKVEGGSVIVTNNQSGGIAAHTVNVLAPMARRISPNQRQLIASSLSICPQAGVEIEIPLGSGPDASNYADDIAAVLRGVGWTVNGPIFSTRTPVSQGLELVQRNRGVATPAMKALARAFDEASIRFTPLFDSTQTLRDDTLGIYIGSPS